MYESKPKKKKEEEGTLAGWESDFFVAYTNEQIMYILAGAEYLQIEPIITSGCKVMALGLFGKTPEEMRQILAIKNDLTKEEEETIKNDFIWCDQ